MSELNASFSLFPTKEKRSDRSPDYSGSIEIPVADIDSLVAHLDTQPESNWRDEPVVKLRIAGWNATSRNGGKSYLNGKISIPQEQQQQAPADDDSIPF